MDTIFGNNKKTLLIFDMDGVLLDSEPLHERAREIMYEKYGVVPDKNFPNPVGKDSGEFWKLVIEQQGLSGDPYEWEKEQFSLVADQIEEQHIQPTEGLREVLRWAKEQGLKIGLASSSNRNLVDRALALLGVAEAFDYTVSGEEVKNKKPAPDVYQAVLKKAGIPAKEALAVEDSAAGVEAARKAGIFCFGYQNPTSKGQKLEKADRVIDSLREIIR